MKALAGLKTLPTCCAAAALAACLAAWPGAAVAQQKIVVGKSPGGTSTYAPVDLGIANGAFKGLTIEIADFPGDARLAQGAAADALDIGLGGGTVIGFEIKGAPMKAVASIIDSTEWLALQVPEQGKVKTIDDLKGKKIAVTTTASLTYYVVRELSRQRGWGSDGIQPVALGAPSSMYAAMKVGEVDGVVNTVDGGYALEMNHEGHILTTFGKNLGVFHSLVIFATDKMIQTRPGELRRFLKGWFDTIDYVQHNKAATVAMMTQVTKLPEPVSSRTYDIIAPAYSKTGKFDPQALQRMKSSLVELGIVDEAQAAKSNLNDLYTEKFLP